MADCGTSGSALDRAVMAAMGVVTGGAPTMTAQQHGGIISSRATQVLASTLVGNTKASDVIGSNEFYGPRSIPGSIVPLLTQVSTTTVEEHQRNQPVESRGHPMLIRAAVAVADPHTSHPQSSFLAQPTYTHYPATAVPSPYLVAQQHQHQQRHHMLIEQQKMQYQQHQMYMMHLHMQQQQQQQQQQSLANDTINKLEQAWTDSASVSTENIISQGEEGHSLFDANYDYHYQSHTNESDYSDFLSSNNNNIAASIEELAQAWKIAEEEDIALHAPSLSNYEFSDESRHLAAAISSPILNDDRQKNNINDVSSKTTNNTTNRKDYMLMGAQHFHNGNIAQAIHCFEAELLLPSTDNAVMAWTMLGKCHAENDQDRLAISCLERAIDIDPYCLEALLALGVSYVNECSNPRALKVLQAWVQNNPTYATIDIDNNNHYPSPLEGVKALLLRALDVVAKTNNGDVEELARVHEALGVCYNVSQEYETAAGYFEGAIELLQQHHGTNDKAHNSNSTLLYTLWNKLGATLANGGLSSERALECYVESLRVRPRYARAWLNMAISHSNLRNYEEAARCYLQALSLNPRATHCWSYLRIALTCLERWDLLPLAASQNLEEFHQHFDFISQ
jgi:peroxin-5